MNHEHPTSSRMQDQWQSRANQDLEHRKALIRERSERREAKARAPIKILLTVAADSRDRAEKACQTIHGLSFVSWAYQQHKTFADSPEGYIPRKELERGGHRFSKEDDRMTEKLLTDAVNETKKGYPDGFTMADLVEITIGQEGEVTTFGSDGDTLEAPKDRARAILYGRIMRNLGYRKVRTHIPAMNEAPGRLGWVYRKETA